ncbi:MAG: DASH family cryptochrome [Cyanobacteria bacterium REEB459]|nr:DASH family cryptochrome [Cyanobacteria bacterium REEB459]
MTTLIWFRLDLRLHDHELVEQALALGQGLIPVYCFDPRQFGHTGFGFASTGSHRARFLWQSVADLRRSLRSLGSDLVVRQGHPETIIPDLVSHLGVTRVMWHCQPSPADQAIEVALSQGLAALGVPTLTAWADTLYHRDQLPFRLTELPELFTPFRQAVERHSSILPPRPSPGRLPPLPPVTPGDLPSLADLGLSPPAADRRAVLTFEGGEQAALARLQDYIWRTDSLRTYKLTRNRMVGANYSSKFSPWLALGCLSPRQVYASISQYETERVSNESTYWLVFELLWRDYFHFMLAKHGDRLFSVSGLRCLDIAWSQHWPDFEAWRSGLTGFPLIDANMRELAATGFMSNRGRQNVASFLTKNLGLDWRLGAQWFESLLIDYDASSNYGNWNYAAGIGNDGRGFRYFNLLKQAQDYDATGNYVKLWLPELRSLPASQVHQPWRLSAAQQRDFGVNLGVDYPLPMVDLEASASKNKAIYTLAEGSSKNSEPRPLRSQP